MTKSSIIDAQISPAVWLMGGVLFVLLATANGAGYRYGVADQAFYIPVVMRVLQPTAFPRDGALIDAEGRLMVLDEIIAAVATSTGASLEAIFLVGYLLSLLLIWTAVLFIGGRVYQNRWATAALALAFTFRHRIPQTSANSLEPYFLPRQLALAVGLLAIAAVLHRRLWTAIALVAACALVHVTTGLWFAGLIGVALAVLDPQLRRLGIAAGIAAVAFLGWAVAIGPLQAANVMMDDSWLQAVASKDSLFATQWPTWAWVANLGFLAALWWAYRARARRGDARPEDRALVWGATALVGLFIITLPLVAAGWSLAVQFQFSRIFWLVDLLATVYLLDAARAFIPRQARDSPERSRGATARDSARTLALALLVLSVSRGVYILLVERPERSLFEVGLTQSPWHDAMSWVRRQPLTLHVLADPGHAWKYGTSVRVSGERDVWLEDVKDAAIAIYSRDVAHRVVERTMAIGDFSALTADHARDLAQRYDLDVLVTTAELPLPLAYRSGQFRIYRLQ